MASASTATATGAESSNISRKPSRLVARSNTLHRLPHSHSGSGAGLWLANSPTSETPDTPTSHVDRLAQSTDSQGAASFPQQQQEATQSGQAKKVYHFSAELARASFGGRPLTLGGGSRDFDPVYANKQATAPSDDDGDVDLDLSFDYISRFDRSSSSSDQQDSSGPAFDSSAERHMAPPTSHFSPDDTPKSLEASESLDAQPATPPKSALSAASSPANTSPCSTGLGATPSPNSKAIRSMRADAVWDKRRKAPPATLALTPGSEAKRQRQLAMQKAQSQRTKAAESAGALLSLSTQAGPSVERRPVSQELVGASIFSPITPATDSVAFRSNAVTSHASEEPLSLTPLSATRRGAAVRRVLQQQDGSVASASTPGSHASTPDSAAIRRAASTSTARVMAKQSSDALRRTPTATAAHSPSYASHATPVQTRRPRSQSNRSFRASASLASLGPPPFPPPNEPLPSPALSPSFQEHSLPSTSAYHTANDANSTLSKAGRTRPSASSIDFSEAARSLRSRTTQTGRSSLDSFRTANSDGLAVTASSHSIHDGRRWASDEGAQPLPPLPPLQRYEALFPGQNDWTTAPPSQSVGAVTSANTASTLSSVPMAFSNTVGSTATTAMTWSMSDQSTPSTLQSPFTPFTPMFSDMMPGTATTSKTQFTGITRPSISSEMPRTGDAHSKTVVQTEVSSLGGAGATLKEASTEEQEQGRGNRNTEQWILTQRQRKALLQQEELASQERLLDADQQAMRLSIRADERISRVVPSVKLPPTTTEDDFAEARSRQDSRSTDTTDDEHHAKVRQTLVISTVSTPDESVDPFHFVSGQPSLMPTSARAMERAASHNAVESCSAKAAVPMTRNCSGTTGPWAQSPLLLNFNLQGPGKAQAQAQDSAASPALTTIIHSAEATPQIDGALDGERYSEAAHHQAVQGLGLDIDYPSTHAGSTRDTGKGFAPITTDLLRKASRYMDQHAHDAVSPHLSIQMSPDADALHRTRPESKEALLTRGSRHEELNKGLGFDLVGGPSPLLPNDCRSPRTVSGQEVGSSGPGGLTALVNGPLHSDITVHRAQVTDRTVHPSRSIASSISAFVYNATPAPTAAETDASKHLDVPTKPKTGSIGWRRSARRSRDTPAQTLEHGMRPDRHLATDSADVKFVNIDLDDGGLETEVSLGRDDANKSGDSAKAGQWVSKLWSAVASPRRTSFNLGAAPGDRSVDLELANSSAGEQSRDQEQAPAPPAKSERTASRGSFRPLSLVEKRRSSGRYQLEAARQRFRSPPPGEDDEVAEKDARAVALRLLAGSPRIPPSVEEGVPAEDSSKQSIDRADLSAEEREKERIEALKKLRRMSAVERQKKRSSGIGYITSAGSPRLSYITDKRKDAEEAQGADAAVRHGGLSRVASLNKTNKRMSLTVFGGKERATTGEAAGAPERGWLDAMRSPRVAESPSGFTPHMTFDPQDWGAGSGSQQQQQQHHHQQLYGQNQAPAGPSSANHIPLMLSNSATSRRQPSGSAANSIQDHGLTVSELDRARDEMRRLAGQGMAFEQDELAPDAAETFHTPMPDVPGSWGYGAEHHDRQHYVYEGESMADMHAAGQHQTTELGDFGISPEKKQPRLHRRTRTARFADEDQHHLYEQDQDQPTVSIFTRSQQHRHRASGSFSVQYGSHAQPPMSEHRSRSKRRASHYAGAGGGHGLFATPAALLEGNTPSKNMFWAGFFGMPWLWMIGGWYLTPDGQLRHPSADDPRLRGKVDVWQHEPSMQGQGSASSSPHLGSSSTTFGASSYEQSWGLGQGGAESTSAMGLGLDTRPSGTQSAMSFAASSTGTFSSARTTNSDPNMPPPSKTRKSKTRGFGTLLDTNPQISFYQSPVRVVQEPQPSFGNVWRNNQGMEPLLEMAEPRRSRLFAGYPDEYDHDRAYTASPAVSSSDGSTAVSAAELRGKTTTASGYQVAVATKTSVATPWKDLERYVLLNRVAAILSGVLVFAGFTGAVIRGRYEKLVRIQQQQQQQQQQQTKEAYHATSSADLMASRRLHRQPRVDDGDDDGGGEKETKRGLTSWDAVRWLSSHATPNGSPTRQKSDLAPAATKDAPAAAGNSSMLLAGAAASLAATSFSSSAATTTTPGGLGGLLTALLNPSVALSASNEPSSAAQQGGAEAMLTTLNHLVFLRAIFCIIFRVMVLMRITRFRNSAMPISALVLNELLG
ncbi:uncharacterized protein SRS1_14468 [Sporisorium reilianum f. sp. reilianum]|uniref:Uncharacterized protein n=1 Tax=Sporisorium reilianum f. sp. reilianum TaxID=72559 RepID=A0A2N8UG30_9BASI|nr:uncharacterized protein SRS1_14468 [Sporisorium reilianum f. sp. reilianum]